MPYRTDAGGSEGCPACGSALLSAGAGLYPCAACGGVWADLAASQRIARELSFADTLTADNAAANASRPAPADGERRCPVCRAALEASKVFAVTLDTCAVHGTWFDRDELQGVARALGYERQRLGRHVDPTKTGSPGSTTLGPAAHVPSSVEWTDFREGQGATAVAIVGAIVGILTDRDPYERDRWD